MNKNFKYFFIVPLNDRREHLKGKYALFFFRNEISAPVVQKEDYWYEYLTAEEVGQELGGFSK